MVRSGVPSPHRTDRALRAAVHHRGALRPPGRRHHERPVRRRPHCRPAADLLRADVDRFVRRWAQDGLPVRPQRLDRVHRDRQQFRTCDRRCDRRVRCVVGPGPRRRRGTTDRSPCPRRPRVRVTVGSAGATTRTTLPLPHPSPKERDHDRHLGHPPDEPVHQQCGMLHSGSGRLAGPAPGRRDPRSDGQGGRSPGPFGNPAAAHAPRDLCHRRRRRRTPTRPIHRVRTPPHPAAKPA